MGGPSLLDHLLDGEPEEEASRAALDLAFYYYYHISTLNTHCTHTHTLSHTHTNWWTGLFSSDHLLEGGPEEEASRAAWGAAANLACALLRRGAEATAASLEPIDTLRTHDASDRCASLIVNRPFSTFRSSHIISDCMLQRASMCIYIDIIYESYLYMYIRLYRCAYMCGARV